ncbi:MAG TPA: phosphatidate cytidylyltransferase [Bacillaceae bacterium]|nr:phosphatidate cytidylyltransferase [Paenibacillus bovis]HLU21871.1 phosphatidate cytidylyltransferase [Bacillaceae bacterium]
MKQRIITAAILIAIFLPLVIIGGIPFLILTYIMATIGLYELFAMRKLSIFSIKGFIALLMLWIFLIPNDFVNLEIKLELISAGILLLLSYSVVVKNKFSFADVGFLLISIFYVGIGFYYLVHTREAGLIYLLYALFVVWVTDSGAYFVGRKFGRKKLWPEISPNKTVEGFVGGIISALIIAILFIIFTDLDIPFINLMLITVVLSIFGQLGDLVESALKRHYGVKDSGNIFPGHGGILDRCDSWLFVLPLLSFFHVF